MAISYFISVPSFKSTVFVVWILARVGGGEFTPTPCFKATSETPCTIGLIVMDVGRPNVYEFRVLTAEARLFIFMGDFQI